MFLKKISKILSADIGIDLGTANCLLFIKDRGVVLNEPSVVAINTDTNKVEGVGAEAKRMLGKTPVNIAAIRPMKRGVIADFDFTELMLSAFIRKASSIVSWHQKILRPTILIAVPSGITEVEKRAVQDSAKHAGAGDVILIEEPMAAAVGVGLPVSAPAGSMIVDIGGGTTEVAVISLSGIVSAKSVRVGGDDLDSAITQHMKKFYNLQVGELTAENIKIKIGSAYPVKDEETLEVKGLDIVTKVPKTVNISAKEVRNALQEPVTSIIEAVHSTLELCPPDLAADLIDRGIMLAGGGALLAGLDRLLTEKTGLNANVAEDPLNAVARGTGIMLQEGWHR